MNKNCRTGHQIVGTAPCPVCQLRDGDPNAESRANLGADGRVSCVLCGRVSNPLPPNAAAVYNLHPVVRKTIVELISDTNVDALTFKAGPPTTGDGHGAYHLGGSIDSILTTVSLSRGQFGAERIEISFCDFDLPYAEKPSRDIGQDYDRKSLGCKVPVSIDQAAQKLIADGYRFFGSTIGETMRNLRFKKGSAIPGTTAIAGVSASISWTADY